MGHRRNRISRDRAKVSNGSQYDGNYLISTSELGISAEDVVLGYRQLAERIKARAPGRPDMLLIRLAEQELGQTWCELKKHLSTLEIGLLKTPQDDVREIRQIREELADVFKTSIINSPTEFLYFAQPLR